MPKTPQDHRPMAADASYSFTVTENGKPKTYHLPPAQSAADKVSGKFLRDAYMDGDDGQMRLGFAMLEALEVDAGIVDALYSLPAFKMLEHLEAWMSFTASEEDASLGESSSSSI